MAVAVHLVPRAEQLSLALLLQASFAPTVTTGTTTRTWGGTAIRFASGGVCRLCGVGAGVSVLDNGTVYCHADSALTEGLCRSCARSQRYRRAHRMRPDHPDPPIRGTHQVAYTAAALALARPAGAEAAGGGDAA